MIKDLAAFLKILDEFYNEIARSIDEFVSWY